VSSPARPEPPYLQVVNKIRDDVLSGRLAEGDAVPSARKIASEWGIAIATATKALNTLRAEGLVRGVPGVGTVVATRSNLAHSALARSTAVRRTGRIYPPNHYARITSVEFETASEQVALALGIDIGAGVISRRRTTYDENDAPLSVSISWFDGTLAGKCPALLHPERIVQGTSKYIEERTGRTIVSGRDQLAAGAATAEQAISLQIEIGSPVLLGRNRWLDNEGHTVEFGESASPSWKWASYEYSIVE
jgi:DNA-binding GntR family transcriptional regulator